MIKKFKITKYDKTITEPPFDTIQIDNMEITEPQEEDEGGREFYTRVVGGCRAKGYVTKFYTLCSDEDYDYEVVVYNFKNKKDE